MFKINKTEHFIAFVPDGRFRARKNGYLVGLRWQNCEVIAYPGNSYADYYRYETAAVKLWGPVRFAPLNLRRYYITEAREHGRLGTTWTYTMYLKTEKDYTLLTLGVE
jgi:hypothetical protein